MSGLGYSSMGGSEAFWLAVAVLVYVTGQRLYELRVAQRNTVALLEAGGREHGAGHYPAIVVMHACWLIGLWLFAVFMPASGAATTAVYVLPLVLFAAVQVVRFWTLATLGARWTTRIITVPDEQLVQRGPFRYVSHPNYLVVIAEICLLPLAFGLPLYAAVFSALNAAVLTVRISAEERALLTVGDRSP
ncbi:MAG: isoprenylcysteine carboxylmethyltransferase family protein [Pseudomonadota bacterium]